MIDFAELTADTGLVATATTSADVLTLKLEGVAELPAWSAMNAIATKLHADAVAARLREVVVDVTQLEFMSSSSFKALVTWINDITELPPEQRYTLRFRSNPQLLWQRRSLHVLKTFATELVFVEEV